MTSELSDGSPISVMIEGRNPIYGIYNDKSLFNNHTRTAFFTISPWDSTHPLAKQVQCVQKVTHINLKFVTLVQELENSNVKTADTESRDVKTGTDRTFSSDKPIAHGDIVSEGRHNSFEGTDG